MESHLLDTYIDQIATNIIIRGQTKIDLPLGTITHQNTISLQSQE